MKKILLTGLYFFSIFPVFSETDDTLHIQGQFSAWSIYSTKSDIQLGLGARYIPQLDYSLALENNSKIDFEASVNLNGSLGLIPDGDDYTGGHIKPYRLWVRYSTEHLELRTGLQKISFGSATLLRPLMWFDQLDPRDPLQLTDGVWGVLGRYYFPNNANLWLWGLEGNKNLKAWETIRTDTRLPEFGGRFQQPIPKGELAISYHHRTADFESTGLSNGTKIPESRIGLDGKWDLGIGLWFEGTWTNQKIHDSYKRNTELLNIGTDYTIPLGNGLHLLGEHLFVSIDENPFSFDRTYHFSAFSATYPIGIFDNLSGIVFYDWKSRGWYNNLDWKRQYDKTSYHLILYHNPTNYALPNQVSTTNLFAGTGILLMFVFNH